MLRRAGVASAPCELGRAGPAVGVWRRSYPPPWPVR